MTRQAEAAEVGGPDTRWLTATNILLGAFVAVCFVIIILGWICEAISSRRKRASYEAELNHDMEEMFGVVPPRGAAVGTVPSRKEIGPPQSRVGILARLCGCLGHVGGALWRRRPQGARRPPG